VQGCIHSDLQNYFTDPPLRLADREIAFICAKKRIELGLQRREMSLRDEERATGR